MAEAHLVELLIISSVIILIILIFSLNKTLEILSALFLDRYRIQDKLYTNTYIYVKNPSLLIVGSIQCSLNFTTLLSFCLTHMFLLMLMLKLMVVNASSTRFFLSSLTPGIS